MSRRVAVAASAAVVRGAAGPMEYLAASFLEQVPQRKDALLDRAAELVAEAADPLGEAAAIEREYLSRPPRVAPAAHSRDPSMLGLGGPALTEAEAAALAEQPPVGPLPQRDDGRRPEPETEAAVTVLCRATLRQVRLADYALSAALRLRLRSRSGGDAAPVLRRYADKLRDASRAAGTAAPPTTAREWRADRAVAAGAGTDEIAERERVSREWRELHSRGCTRMTEERYTDLSMSRWRRDHP